MYINLNASKGAADFNYFSAASRLGYRTFQDFGYKVSHSSVRNVRAGLINLLAEDDIDLVEPLDHEPVYL